jgi:O-antigen/teichoic acid export membrane protein
VATVHIWAPSIEFLAQEPLWAAAFIIGTASWNIFSVQDSVLAALRRTPWVPVENVAYSLCKLALLIGLVSLGGGAGIFISWMIPGLGAAIVVTALIFTKLLPRLHDRSPVGGRAVTMKPAVRLVLGNYAGFIASLGSSTMLPIIVLNEGGAQGTASFYAAWNVAFVLPLVATSLSTSFTVEAASNRPRAHELARQTLLMVGVVVVPMVIVVLVLAPEILSVFGPTYSSDAAGTLRLLALAGIPNIFVTVGLGLARVHDRGLTIAVVQIAMAVITIGLTLLLFPAYGIMAAGCGWLAAQLCGGTLYGVAFLRRR